MIKMVNFIFVISKLCFYSDRKLLHFLIYFNQLTIAKFINDFFPKYVTPLYILTMFDPVCISPRKIHDMSLKGIGGGGTGGQFANSGLPIQSYQDSLKITLSIAI